ncbi:MAG: UDP-N-acetylmuramoyl-L-alanyl-D-glutamate--2,6-diaminopimelate ligase [Deltaproteobacteria bacterium]|nr:UDP-N-acetylmuramoyl-L-alanyl-D-glutamate--2,6-diaminopimelate ligase [Deltaproteobacteria bacterium]
MLLPDLMQGIEHRRLAGAEGSVLAGLEIGKVTTDSRAAGPGVGFFAVPGSQADGHDFLADALARGATLLALEREEAAPALSPDQAEGVAVLRVEDGRAALAEAAANLAGRPAERLPLVGITGTNGKTTVSWILESIARAAGRPSGLVGTVAFRFAGIERPATHTTPGPEILQPLLAEMVEAGTELAVLEVSSHALDQRRVEGCRFRAAVFTGLSRDHLDYHPDLESYFQAKARLFHEHLEPGAAAVVSLDGEWGRRLHTELAERGLEPVGTSATDEPAEGAAAFASEIRLGLEGIRATLHLPRTGALPIRSEMVGRHNLANLLSAAATAEALGISGEQIREGIAAFPGPPGRLQRVADPRAGTAPRHTFVDYAHTDDALLRVIEGLRLLSPPSARIVVVFGCGGDRDRGKRPLMAAAAARADRVVVTSDNPRSEDPEAIIAEILPGLPVGCEHQVEADRRRAIEQAAGLAGPGDVLLIAGKGHETYQLIGDRKLPFDDAKVAASALLTVAPESRSPVAPGTRGGGAEG